MQDFRFHALFAKTVLPTGSWMKFSTVFALACLDRVTRRVNGKIVAAEIDSTGSSGRNEDVNGGDDVDNNSLHPLARRRRFLQEDANNSTVLQLRQALLENYDRKGFPFDDTWANNDGEGLRVEVGLNFHRIFEVDVASSVADMIVWLRMEWVDPRLAWDPAIYDGNLQFFVGEGNGAGETSEIWTPDLQLWNLESSLSNSLADTFAVVSSDGTVFWSRPGHVKPVCRFQGLDDFPFDTLSCTMEIGSWSYSGQYLRPSKFGEGYSIGGSETAGASFAEYSLRSVACEEFIYPPFPGQDADWPVLLYHVQFQRAWQPYVRGYLVLQIFLNFISFCCFWLPPHVGERMGLAISSVLAAVASDLVVAAQLPTASELTWFAKFSFTSLMFSSVVLFESTAVIYLYYHTGSSLIPGWATWLHRKMKNKKQPAGDDNECSSTSTSRRGCCRCLQRRGRQSHHGDTEKTEDCQRESGTTFVENYQSSSETNSMGFDQQPQSQHQYRARSMVSVDATATKNNENDCAAIAEEDSGDIDSEDSDGSSSLDPDQLEASLANISQKMLQRQRSSRNVVRSENDDGGDADQLPNNRRRKDIHRPSFMASMTSFRTRKGVKTILGRDADDFKNAEEMENNVRWQKIARWLDHFSRVFFPTTFCVFLAIMFAIVDI